MTVNLSDGVRVEVHQPQPPRIAVLSPVGRQVLVPVRGPQGIPGIAGGGYVHTQAIPLATWTMTHNLGKRIEPAIFLDPDTTVQQWTDLQYPSENVTVAIFDQPVSGFAEF